MGFDQSPAFSLLWSFASGEIVTRKVKLERKLTHKGAKQTCSGFYAEISRRRIRKMNQ